MFVDKLTQQDLRELQFYLRTSSMKSASSMQNTS
jgi:hypothetical protein